MRPVTANPFGLMVSIHVNEAWLRPVCTGRQDMSTPQLVARLRQEPPTPCSPRPGRDADRPVCRTPLCSIETLAYADRRARLRRFSPRRARSSLT